MQSVKTLFWITLMMALLKLSANLLLLGESQPNSWINSMPTLFFTLARAVVSLIIIYYVLTHLWGIDIGNLATAVGVGSIVIALALQSTLSNLVSGFLLLLDRPFKTGDWIAIDHVWYEVIDVNWRATRLRGADSMSSSITVYPNGKLANAIIDNYGMSKTGDTYQFNLEVVFSYDDPPNKVKQLLLKLLQSIDHIDQSPTHKAPNVTLQSYLDKGIEYRLQFWSDPWLWDKLLDEVKTDIYYVAKRHGLTIPYPTIIEYRADMAKVSLEDHSEKIQTALQTAYLFQDLDNTSLNHLAASARLSCYGAGERLVREGEQDEGFYVIHQGGVLLTAENQAGEQQTIARLAKGDFFGEMDILFHDGFSPVSITAATDSEIVIIPEEVIRPFIQRNHTIALELNTIVEERKKIFDALCGVKETNKQKRGLRLMIK